ncbi:hypothetical protein E4U43_002517 [Claviceps pusilla]|uniref:Uncharacterized protein n=1 Tax=Claviceps pusilla TaxID=123648 RepID=A0A9P7NGZ3_9HYPO|nr:hypothetical protein E4U43_002517 [Claviceps pusilla]
MSGGTSHPNETEPFPAIDHDASIELVQSSRIDDSSKSIVNRPAASSSLSDRLRRVSQSFESSELPEGFFAASGGIASSVLSRHNVARPPSDSLRSAKSPAVSSGAANTTSRPAQPVPNEQSTVGHQNEGPASKSAAMATAMPSSEPVSAASFDNGYHFPPKHSFAKSMKLGTVAFWNYVLTPVGFVVTLYGLNVVAWGGMLFLLLCNASPAMCHPTCDDINSPRRIWIEIDSQILNALFCVTGFGLAPWRFRDLYFLLQYRLNKKVSGLRRLAGIHRGWFRLKGSTDLPSNLGPHNIHEPEFQSILRPAIPFPEAKIPDPPLTGVRAPWTAVWKLDLVIWLMVANTFFQCVLSGFMWGMNRYDRPSWSTGLFVALGCLVAGVGGFIMFLEGKAVKGIEGVPVSQQDKNRLDRDRERGIWHYNNLQDKDLKAEKRKAKV